MTKMKGLLLGAAAGLVTVASAQAADLPVKAAPVEYVKVCSLYGAGFFYIPGTDTCLKIGGYIRSDHAYGATAAGSGGYYLSALGGIGSGANRLQTDNYTFRARINLTTDFRTQSDYGTIRAYAAIIGQQSQGDASGNGSAGILRAFIQFAGFTVGHAVSYFDFMNGADYGYAPSVWNPSTGVNGTDLIAYTWQIGNGFSASIDIEDGGNGVGPGGGTGRGKVLVNASNGSTLSAPGTPAGLGGVTLTNDAARAEQPDFAANIRVDQAWGSAQVMAALHNASGGYYSNFPGLAAPVAVAPGLLPGSTVFGHPGEAWGYALGAGAKFVNFILPRDTLEGQANFCHGAQSYCVSTGLYGQSFVYGSGNTVSMSYAVDGVFVNGSQIELTNGFNWALAYQHYWNPQWRTAIVGGQAYTWYSDTAKGMLCGTVAGAANVGGAGGVGINGIVNVANGITACNPNSQQSSFSTRTAWNPHPFLEIGLDLIWYHNQTSNGGSNIFLTANGARPSGTYTVGNLDAYAAILRFQKNILP
jgi:Porin subfamily